MECSLNGSDFAVIKEDSSFIKLHSVSLIFSMAFFYIVSVTYVGIRIQHMTCILR